MVVKSVLAKGLLAVFGIVLLIGSFGLFAEGFENTGIIAFLFSLVLLLGLKFS